MIRFVSTIAMAVAVSLCTFSCKKTEEPAPETHQAASTSAPSSAEPTASPEPPAPPQKPVDPALLKPEEATAKAPAKFKVKFTTTKGDFVVEARRAWAPIGADRFYNLVKLGFFTDIGFFRVVPNFVVQFGIHGNPKVAAAWKAAPIKDDPKSKQSNDKGTLTFAKGGPDSRTTQLFINFNDNPRLDGMGFPPVGKVIEGMDVVEKINQEYGEQPNQQRIQSEGNEYLKDIFRRLDYIQSAKLVK